jgi:hypothetical protein
MLDWLRYQTQIYIQVFVQEVIWTKISDRFLSSLKNVLASVKLSALIAE